MKRITSTLLIITMLLFALPVTGFAAEDNGDVNPGLTPDSWLYGLDNFIKELQLLITFDTVEKADLLHDISEERLAEAKKMVDENKAKYGLVAMEAYKAVLEKAINILDDAIINEKNIDDVIIKFNDTLSNRRELIKSIIEQLPEEIKDEINKSIDESIEIIEVTVEVTDNDSDEIADEDSEEIDEIVNGSDVDPDEKDEDSKDSDEAASEDPEKDKDEDEEASEDLEKDKDEDEEASKDTEKDKEEDSEEVTDQDSTVYIPLKKVITVEILTELMGDGAGTLYASGILNLRQLLTIYSLSEQTGKSLDEVAKVFAENNKGIGATAQVLGLTPKAALKGIKETFKDVKKQVQKDFKEAKKGIKADWPVKSDDGEDKDDDKQQDENEDKDRDAEENASIVANTAAEKYQKEKTYKEADKGSKDEINETLKHSKKEKESKEVKESKDNKKDYKSNKSKNENADNGKNKANNGKSKK